MRVIFIVFVLTSIVGSGQSPIPLANYDLYSASNDDQVFFQRDKPQVSRNAYMEMLDPSKSASDSIADLNHALYSEISIHFFNERTLFWNSGVYGDLGWQNELKGCGYEIDVETSRIQISVSALSGYNGTELYHFEIKKDTLILTKLDGKKVKDIFIKRKENEFSEPWNQEKPSIIIDAYGPNAIDWNEIKKDANVIGVIHKCSEGLVLDKKYKERSEKAKELDYLWGSYHLGRSGDPIEQAQFYLSQIEDLEKDLIALDLEDIDNPKFMNLENALIFIDFVRENTGRYPVLYCNNNVLNQININYGAASSFSKCPLWYARFKREVTDYHATTWPSYTLWQFSCEINCRKTGECLYNVPGCEFDMDINIFNGSHQETYMLWPFRYR